MVRALIIFIISLFNLAVANAEISSTKLTPIVIGTIYNLTGSQGALDVASLQGAKLANKEINAAGGVLGKPLELEVINGRSEQCAITKAAKQLAAKSSLPGIIIGLNDTDMALAAIPPIVAKEKLFMTTGATSPKLSAIAPESVLFTCFVDSDQAAAAAEYAYDKLHAKKAVIIEQSDMIYSRLLSKYFEQRFNQLGGKILKNYHFADNRTYTIANQLRTIKTQKVKPEIFYLASGTDNVPKIIQEIRKAGFNQAIIGGDSFDASYVYSRIKKTKAPIYFTSHAFIATNNPDPKVAQFIKAYRKIYNIDPTSSFAALGYDTIKLIAKAIEDANSIETAKVHAALLNIHNYDGITGTFNFSAANPIPEKTISIIEIKDGKKSLAEELQPKKRF